MKSEVFDKLNERHKWVMENLKSITDYWEEEDYPQPQLLDFTSTAEGILTPEQIQEIVDGDDSLDEFQVNEVFEEHRDGIVSAYNEAGHQWNADRAERFLTRPRLQSFYQPVIVEEGDSVPSESEPDLYFQLELQWPLSQRPMFERPHYIDLVAVGGTMYGILTRPNIELFHQFYQNIAVATDWVREHTPAPNVLYILDVGLLHQKNKNRVMVGFHLPEKF
jgi:hypothetical protein